MNNSKVERLNNRATKRHYRKQRFQFLNRPISRRICVATGVFLFFAIPLVVSIHTVNRQNTAVQRQIQHSQATLQNARVENKSLKFNVKQLNNSEYVQQLIRDKYYYTKSGETVYSLPGDVARDVTQN